MLLVGFIFIFNIKQYFSFNCCEKRESRLIWFIFILNISLYDEFYVINLLYRGDRDEDGVDSRVQHWH